jgi:hypothetical protein
VQYCLFLVKTMIRALGKTVTLATEQTLSKHDFQISLSDVLLDLVEENPDGPLALSYSQLACSLAHDFVNLATVAGQLLWYVGVAPLRTGTPDSLLISLLAESYLVSVRTAYDTIAATILRFCIPPRLRGQLPKNESFNDLVEWVQKNPTRAPIGIQFVTDERGLFKELRGIRDKLVHDGYELCVYTNAIAPSFCLISSGEAKLHFLRTPRTRFPNAPTPQPLLPFLKRATRSVISLADKVAERIGEQYDRNPSCRHVLNGVYVPALNHILSYESPIQSEVDERAENRRKMTARYLLRAGDYLSSINYGYPDEFWWSFVLQIEELFGAPPAYVSKPEHPAYRDGEALADWQLRFQKGDNEHIIFLKDARFVAIEGENSDVNLLQAVRKRHPHVSVVLVSNLPISQTLPITELPAEFIIDADPVRAAQRAFDQLTSGDDSVWTLFLVFC